MIASWMLLLLDLSLVSLSCLEVIARNSKLLHQQVRISLARYSVPSLLLLSPKILWENTRSKRIYIITLEERRTHSRIKLGYICDREHRRKWCKKPAVISRELWLSVANHDLHRYLSRSRIHRFLFFLLSLFANDDRTSLELCRGKMGAHWPIGESVISLPPFHNIFDPRCVSEFLCKLLIRPNS